MATRGSRRDPRARRQAWRTRRERACELIVERLVVQQLIVPGSIGGQASVERQ
jgi:hypothetical protein